MSFREKFIDRVSPIIRELFDDYKGPITSTLSADDVAGWDSLAHVQLIVMVERAHSVKLSAVEVSKVKNLGELADLVGSKATQNG